MPNRINILSTNLGLESKQVREVAAVCGINGVELTGGVLGEGPNPVGCSTFVKAGQSLGGLVRADKLAAYQQTIRWLTTRGVLARKQF